MKIFILVLSLIVSQMSFANTASCNDFTHRQIKLLYKSYNAGFEHNYGYTLAAITWRESFWGDYVIKINEGDKGGGSYGLTHIQLDTAMHLLEYDSRLRAKDELIPQLLSDDDFSLTLSIMKLDSVQYKAGGSWSKLWMLYNGNNPEYGKDIAKRVKILKQCRFFD